MKDEKDINTDLNGKLIEESDLNIHEIDKIEEEEENLLV